MNVENYAYIYAASEERKDEKQKQGQDSNVLTRGQASELPGLTETSLNLT